jgi:hypothetical protein
MRQHTSAYVDAYAQVTYADVCIERTGVCRRMQQSFWRMLTFAAERSLATRVLTYAAVILAYADVC